MDTTTLTCALCGRERAFTPDEMAAMRASMQAMKPGADPASEPMICGVCQITTAALSGVEIHIVEVVPAESSGPRVDPLTKAEAAAFDTRGTGDPALN